MLKMEISLFHIIRVTPRVKQTLIVSLLAATAIVASGCKSANILNTSQTFNEGYVLDPSALASIPVGSSRDQVLLALGSPSVTAMYEKIANYGLQDGKIFDTVSQTTPTGGHDQSFLSQLIKGSKGVPTLPSTGR